MSWLRRFIRYRLRGYPDPRKLQGGGLQLGEGAVLGAGGGIMPWHCWPVEIGDWSGLAPHVNVLAHDTSTKAHLGYTRIGEVVIGKHVFVGAHTTVLPDVRIGDRAVIAPGSVVGIDVP